MTFAFFRMIIGLKSVERSSKVPKYGILFLQGGQMGASAHLYARNRSRKQMKGRNRNGEKGFGLV